MKKSKLGIHRETLRRLSSASLEWAGGALGVSVVTNTSVVCGYSLFGPFCDKTTTKVTCFPDVCH